MKPSENIQREIEAFFESYRAAFDRYNSDSIVMHFVYPCHVVSDADPVALLPMASKQDCRAGVDRVLDRHRTIGVVSGEVTEFIVTELSPRLVSVSLKKDFHDDAGRRLYDFQGVYTLVLRDGFWKIAAISHNQIPRLQNCVSQKART